MGKYQFGLIFKFYVWFFQSWQNGPKNYPNSCSFSLDSCALLLSTFNFCLCFERTNNYFLRITNNIAKLKSERKYLFGVHYIRIYLPLLEKMWKCTSRMTKVNNGRIQNVYQYDIVLYEIQLILSDAESVLEDYQAEMKVQAENLLAALSRAYVLCIVYVFSECILLLFALI